MKSFLEIHPEVKNALAGGMPVVALESTIISHGMPFPQNVDMALSVEEAIRKNGATPATIAIFNGRCYVGLTGEQINHFARAKDVWKVSLRDMPFVISKNLFGATTVAATARIAHAAGISVFVTGGIGGVHRGAESSMDISADLPEMAKTSIAIVSAGIKSILDIGLTLEYLETQGVPVVTIGQDELPGFYSSKSGYASPLRMDTVDEIAKMLEAKWALGLEGAVLVANPVPAECEIPQIEIEASIEKALAEAGKNHIRGKDITPFLLKFIAEHTKGESLDTNIALIKNNAIAGAQLAVAYHKCRKNKQF